MEDSKASLMLLNLKNNIPTRLFMMKLRKAWVAQEGKGTDTKRRRWGGGGASKILVLIRGCLDCGLNEEDLVGGSISIHKEMRRVMGDRGNSIVWEKGKVPNKMRKGGSSEKRTIVVLRASWIALSKVL